VQVPDLQRAESSRVLELQGSRAPWLQDSKVAGFHGSKVTKLQESTVAGFHGFKAFRVKGSRVPEQKPFAIPCRKPCRNFSGHLNKTCRFSLSFVSLV